MLNIVTFTGVDDRTNIDTLIDLYSEFYTLEFGVLLSENNRDSRFPSVQTITELLKKNDGIHNTSLHLCGKLVDVFLENPEGFAPKAFFDYSGKQLIYIDEFSVIQLNKLDISITRKLEDFTYSTNTSIILPHNTVETLQEYDNPLILPLYDPSKGRGILPTKFPKNIDYIVGFAGGINADTIEYYLDNIHSDHSFWIDMESGIRTNGWFDINKVKEIIKKLENMNE